MEKPFAPSCERNRGPILNVLTRFLNDRKRVLEVGSGTGQHAVHFAPQFPNLTWVTSDVVDNHPGIETWLKEANLKNIEGPIPFKLGEDSFPTSDVDAIFTANTFHIMAWEDVEELISLSGANLKPKSLFIVYGPFKYNNEFTSDSNLEFHMSLMDRNPKMGIRDFHKVNEQFEKRGFRFLEDIPMPANNQTLVFEKK